MGSPLRNLSRVDVYVSIVLNSDLDSTWRQARDFGHAPYWAQAGRGQFLVRRLKGRASSEVGSGRMFKVGEGRLYEKLTALDDCKHNMRWILISHPHTLSPFGEASFLNYTSKLRFRKVTESNETFGEWKGEFYTEPRYAEEMETLLSGWYRDGFQGLQVSAGGSDSRKAVPRETLMDPTKSVPVAPPSQDQATFIGPGQNIPQQQDMAYHLTNWALRKFKYQEDGLDYFPTLQNQQAIQNPMRHPQQMNPSMGAISQTTNTHSPGNPNSWHTRDSPPSSPRTAPIQDTISRMSTSTSNSSGGRLSGFSRSTGLSPHQNMASMDYTSRERGIPGQSRLHPAHPSGDFHPYLRPITEEVQNPYPEPMLTGHTSNPHTWNNIPHNNPSKQFHQDVSGQHFQSQERHSDPGIHQNNDVISQRSKIPRHVTSNLQHSPSIGSENSRNMQSKSSVESLGRSSQWSGGMYRSGGPTQYQNPNQTSQSDLHKSMQQQAGLQQRQAHISQCPPEIFQHQETHSQNSGGSHNSWGSQLNRLKPTKSGLSGLSRQQSFNPHMQGLPGNSAWMSGQENPNPACPPNFAHEEDLDGIDKSSLDEQVSFMQERHNLMHNEGDPKMACSSPFAQSGPFGQVTDPFQEDEILA